MRLFTLFLALKHIRRRSLQSSLTIMGVAVGVMVLITSLSLTNGFIAELVRSTLKATPHITLSSLTGDTLSWQEETRLAILEHPEVVAVAPYIETQALIARRADASLGISARQGFTQIIGIDPELEQEVLADLPSIAEQASVLAVDDGILLGSTLSRNIGAFSGDEVQILNVTQKRRSFRVAASFRVGNEFIDALVSYTSIPTLQDYLNKEGEISGYHVRLKDPERANAVASELSEQGYLARSWQSLFSTLLEQLRLQKALIAVVVFLIVLVAAMGIANILILTVSEKREEIAILRAMGASQRQILTVFTLEGLLLGGTGTLLGALLGFAVSLYFQFQPFPLPGDLYFITQLPVDLQAFDFIWVCSVSLLTSVVAGLIPARRASNLNPVEIIR